MLVCQLLVGFSLALVFSASGSALHGYRVGPLVVPQVSQGAKGVTQGGAQGTEKVATNEPVPNDDQIHNLDPKFLRRKAIFHKLFLEQSGLTTAASDEEGVIKKMQTNDESEVSLWLKRKGYGLSSNAIWPRRFYRRPPITETAEENARENLEQFPDFTIEFPTSSSSNEEAIYLIRSKY